MLKKISPIEEHKRDDLILVRLKGVLTVAEHQLAETGDDSAGRSLIKQMRIALLEKGRPVLETIADTASYVPRQKVFESPLSRSEAHVV